MLGPDGILMRDADADRRQLQQIGGKPIELVCVNLYPFEQTVARGAAFDETLENIDIGGPSMARSAAKNQARVVIVTDPDDYGEVLEAVSAGDGPSSELRARLAARAFGHTAAYDGAIAAYLTGREQDGPFPGTLTLSLEKGYRAAGGLVHRGTAATRPHRHSRPRASISSASAPPRWPRPPLQASPHSPVASTCARAPPPLYPFGCPLRPGCATCHDMIDPIGLAFESFDTTGRFRTEDKGGTPVDTKSDLRVPGGETVPIDGPLDLSTPSRTLNPGALRG